MNLIWMEFFLYLTSSLCNSISQSILRTFFASRGNISLCHIFNAKWMYLINVLSDRAKISQNFNSYAWKSEEKELTQYDERSVSFNLIPLFFYHLQPFIWNYLWRLQRQWMNTAKSKMLIDTNRKKNLFQIFPHSTIQHIFSVLQVKIYWNLKMG